MSVVSKKYSKSYLEKWSKKELIDYIGCLQHNLECEERGNDHIYKTFTAVIHKDPQFAKAVDEVLDTWNNSFGHRYINYEENQQ